MKTNYHTHTFRCRHATGTEREYLENALKAGFSVFGFSDHTPYPFENGYCSPFRMHVEEATDYFDTIRRLREEYRGRLEIPVGVEAEYYPAYFDGLLRMLRKTGCEYLLLGQHYLQNELGAAYSGSMTRDDDILRAYVRQTTEALKTGLFSCFAHPDLLYYRGSAEVYRREMTALCEAAAREHVPLEFNLLGFGQGRGYPYLPFWRIVAEVGNEVVIGCDAHSPEAVRCGVLRRQAEEYLAGLGLKPKEMLTLRPLG